MIVFSTSFFPDFVGEFSPFFFVGIIQEIEIEFLNFVLVHFVVESTIVTISTSGRPALELKTLFLFVFTRFILSEVEPLLWCDLQTYGLVKITVWNNAILVYVHQVVDFVELLLCHFETPVIKVKLELVLRDESRCACILIHIGKSFPDSLPLIDNLADYFLF